MTYKVFYWGGDFATLLLKQPLKTDWRRMMRSLHPSQAAIFGGAFWLQQNSDNGFTEQDEQYLIADFGYLHEPYNGNASSEPFHLLLPKGTALPATVAVRDLILRRNDARIQLAQRDTQLPERYLSLGEWCLGEMNENQQTVSIEITLLGVFNGIYSIKIKVFGQEFERWQLIDLPQANISQPPISVRRWLDN